MARTPFMRLPLAALLLATLFHAADGQDPLPSSSTTNTLPESNGSTAGGDTNASPTVADRVIAEIAAIRDQPFSQSLSEIAVSNESNRRAGAIIRMATDAVQKIEDDADRKRVMSVAGAAVRALNDRNKTPAATLEPASAGTQPAETPASPAPTTTTPPAKVPTPNRTVVQAGAASTPAQAPPASASAPTTTGTIQPAAAVATSTVARPQTIEQLVQVMEVLRHEADDNAESWPLEQQREQYEQVIQSSLKVIASTHNRPDQKPVFTRAVENLLESRLFLTLNGDDINRQKLQRDARDVYRRDPTSPAAAKAKAIITRLVEADQPVAKETTPVEQTQTASAPIQPTSANEVPFEPINPFVQAETVSNTPAVALTVATAPERAVAERRVAEPAVAERSMVSTQTVSTPTVEPAQVTFEQANNGFDPFEPFEPFADEKLEVPRRDLQTSRTEEPPLLAQQPATRQQPLTRQQPATQLQPVAQQPQVIERRQPVAMPAATIAAEPTPNQVIPSAGIAADSAVIAAGNVRELTPSSVPPPAPPAAEFPRQTNEAGIAVGGTFAPREIMADVNQTAGSISATPDSMLNSVESYPAEPFAGAPYSVQASLQGNAAGCPDCFRPEKRQYYSDSWHGHPLKACPRPLGDSLYGHVHQFVSRGDAAQMVMFDYDFEPGGTALKPRGRQKLRNIVKMLPRSFSPVVIERLAEKPKLNEARRHAVFEQLSAGAFPIPYERVQVGEPVSRGLDGVEAVIIHETRIQQTRNLGVPTGGNGSSGTTSGF